MDFLFNVRNNGRIKFKHFDIVLKSSIANINHCTFHEYLIWQMHGLNHHQFYRAVRDILQQFPLSMDFQELSEKQLI